MSRMYPDVVGRSLLLNNLLREIITKIRKCVYKWHADDIQQHADDVLQHADNVLQHAGRSTTR